MKPLLNGFAFLSAIGFAASLVSHLSALIGFNGPLGDQTWFLHVGIFVVWIPTVISSHMLSRNVPSKDVWKAALRWCPTWMKYLTYFFFGYAIFNFVLFMIIAPSGHPSAGPMPPSVVRGFSGHWMAFYCAAFAILYSKAHARDEDRPKHCPNGHSVGPLAQFCETCGSPIGPMPTRPK